MSFSKPTHFYAAPATGATVTVPQFDELESTVFINPAGTIAAVTIALPTPTFGATVAGGGAVATPVYSDGTNWKVG